MRATGRPWLVTTNLSPAFTARSTSENLRLPRQRKRLSPCPASSVVILPTVPTGGLGRERLELLVYGPSKPEPTESEFAHLPVLIRFH